MEHHNTIIEKDICTIRKRNKSLSYIGICLLFSNFVINLLILLFLLFCAIKIYQKVDPLIERIEPLVRRIDQYLHV